MITLTKIGGIATAALLTASLGSPADATMGGAVSAPTSVLSAVTSTVSVLGGSTPAVPVDSDTNSVELGLKFVPLVSGKVVGIRFYKGGSANSGTHRGRLWTSGGAKLADVAFAAETTSGWQTITLAAPVSLTAGKGYVVSYLAPVGRYSVTESAFTVQKSSTYFKTPTNAGVYKYGSGGFPTSSYRASNYFVDVVFTPTPTATTSPSPTPTATASPSPTPTATATASPSPTPTATGSNPLASLPLIAWHGGPAYWAQFPDAVKAGWNQPGFFPVGTFWDFWPGGNNASARAAVQWDKDHGVNFYTHGNGDQDACVLRDVGGMSWLGAPGSLQNLSTCGENVWPGNYLEDELDGTSGSHSAAFTELASQSSAARQQTPNKFVGVNYTGIPIQIWVSDADAGRYFNDKFADMISVDDYLFSTPNRCNEGNPNWWPFIGPKPLSLSACRQGQSYGRLTDSMHMRDALDSKRKPLAAFIDIYGGADPAVAVQTPADVKAAAVSNVIHGAGFIIYFPLSFYPSCSTNRLMDASVPACAAAHTAAAGEVNNQIKAWAPILNTQSYQHTFGASLDTALKWYNGSAYIFAMTDGGTGSRTFTLPSGIATPTSVTETISGRTISVIAGKFTDNFAASTDYRLYKVTP